MSVAERLRPATPTRRWVGEGAAALVWVALYDVNLPLWDWVVYDVAGLASAGPLGLGVHFFLGYGVMFTTGLVVEDNVVFSGRALPARALPDPPFRRSSRCADR